VFASIMIGEGNEGNDADDEDVEECCKGKVPIETREDIVSLCSPRQVGRARDALDRFGADQPSSAVHQPLSISRSESLELLL
jgi:hypothetical protein